MLDCHAVAFPSTKQIVSPIVHEVLAIDSSNYSLEQGPTAQQICKIIQFPVSGEPGPVALNLVWKVLYLPMYKVMPDILCETKKCASLIISERSSSGRPSEERYLSF